MKFTSRFVCTGTIEHFQVLGSGGRERSVEDKKSYLSSTLGESFLYMSTWGLGNSSTVAAGASTYKQMADNTSSPSSSFSSKPFGAYPSKNATKATKDSSPIFSKMSQNVDRSPLVLQAAKTAQGSPNPDLQTTISPTTRDFCSQDNAELQSLLTDSVYGSFLEPYRKSTSSSPRPVLGEELAFDGRSIPENILKLLQTIKRLGEENANLLQRIERFKKYENDQKQLITDVAAFKKQYEEKFKRLRELLKEFSETHPHSQNPANLVLPESSVKIPSRDKANEAKRVTQLEKMVQGLLDRIEVVYLSTTV